MIRAFQGKSIEEGAKIALSNRLCSTEGLLKLRYKTILNPLNVNWAGPSPISLYRRGTIYIYYLGKIPIASAFVRGRKNGIKCLDIFVRRNYRRTGIGTEIIRFINVEKMKVCKHDKTSTTFFNSVGL